MRTLWRTIANTVFWSYDRGTWPYDLLVGAIVLFVIFSPSKWFSDKAQVAPTPHVSQVLLQGEDAAGLKVYRVDFHMLVNEPRPGELERRAHDVLKKNVDELRGRTFQVVRIKPVTGEDGTVHSYDVSVKP